MIFFDNNGDCLDRFAYSLSEQHPMELQEENDILKQRCSFHATPEICSLCKFKCPYRKKRSCSND